jgi:hypothetical protein
MNHRDRDQIWLEFASAGRLYKSSGRSVFLQLGPAAGLVT